MVEALGGGRGVAFLEAEEVGGGEWSEAESAVVCDAQRVLVRNGVELERRKWGRRME